MKKFSQFINEGAENCQKSSYIQEIPKKTEDVNESVILGAMLIFGFCALADPEIRKTAGEKLNTVGKGIFAAIGAGVGWAVAKVKAKKEEKKELETEKINRMLIQCKKVLKETPEDQQETSEYKDAGAYMNAYTKAKYDEDGNEIKDPIKVNKKLKEYIVPETYERVLKRANKAATDNTVGEMMQGVAKKAAEMTPEEVEAGENELRDDSINGKIEDAKKKAAELEAERDKKLKEAQEKGDDVLVQSIKDEYEPKIKQANDNINKLNATKQNIENEKQAKIEKELLKQQEDELKAAQKEKEDLEAQKAEKLAATDDDAEKQKIEDEYKTKIEELDKKIDDAKKKVDSTKDSITKLSTPVKPIEEPKKSDDKPQIVKDAEKKVEDLKNEKETKMLEEPDEEKKKQIEKDYDEKIKVAEKDVEDAKAKALEKTGTEEDDNLEGDEEDESNGDDENIEDKEAADDDQEGAEDDGTGKKVHKNPASIWHKKKKKTGGTTKNYYDKDGNSISPDEYHKRLEAFKKKKTKSNEAFNQYYDKMMKMLFE